jgi:hypothetical protein
MSGNYGYKRPDDFLGQPRLSTRRSSAAATPSRDSLRSSTMSTRSSVTGFEKPEEMLPLSPTRSSIHHQGRRSLLGRSGCVCGINRPQQELPMTPVKSPLRSGRSSGGIRVKRAWVVEDEADEPGFLRTFLFQSACGVIRGMQYVNSVAKKGRLRVTYAGCTRCLLVHMDYGLLLYNTLILEKLNR